MTTTKRLTALALAAILAAPLAATAPVMAAEPAGSTSTAPRPADPGPSALPTPGRGAGPTGLAIGPLAPPPAPDDFAADTGADVDGLIDVLLGATDLRDRGGSCYGMITCCNSAWVQGCNADYFEDVCEIYGGIVQIQIFSDGSTNYECHYAD